ncbi:MAG: tRNA (guanosine(37)-N1)-methyltransferase TrmD [Methylococcales bacterium]|nr:tRNA (guanosine(37)-N1)-methyltransferase TrmD [Methylococcales bacterium]MDD5754322.1 tRNA (guanosine(37)-N1)-methyltransferase TrmD [Methylococcales bacterium]
MRFDVITLFPEMVKQSAEVGVTGKAIKNTIVTLNVWNPRDYTHDRHKTVDDRPFGGGQGMVMKYQPLHDAVSSAKSGAVNTCKVVYLSPQGKPLTQALLNEASQLSQLILVAGRYEGVDERFIQHDCDEEWSLGDYVISGGELAALVVIDAITRLLPDVLGNAQSAQEDSHSDGLLDYPQFTRPEMIDNTNSVPDVLLSGNHAEIERWRMKQSLGRTWQKRPDLLQKKTLSAEQECLLAQFKVEVD